MSGPGRWWRRVRTRAARERFRDELAEEMAFHREEMARELESDGMAPKEARYAAMRQFGNAPRLQEHSEEVVRFRMETVAQDVRFAVRQLRKSPGFAVTAIVMLALGIGASTAIFGFVDAALIRPLPFAQPNRGRICRARTTKTGSG
jgi:macrolide transport system ATP-binding/permease protein